LDVVADAGGFEDDLVGVFFEDGAAEVGDHNCVLGGDGLSGCKAARGAGFFASLD
jgi:hypothetical protein